MSSKIFKKIKKELNEIGISLSTDQSMVFDFVAGRYESYLRELEEIIDRQSRELSTYRSDGSPEGPFFDHKPKMPLRRKTLRERLEEEAKETKEKRDERWSPWKNEGREDPIDTRKKGFLKKHEAKTAEEELAAMLEMMREE